MKLRTYLSEVPTPAPSAKAGKLAVVEMVTAEADLKLVRAAAGHEPLYMGADAVGYAHGAAVAEHGLGPLVQAGLLPPAQARAARLLRVQMRTHDRAAATHAQLPASTGWSRLGPAIGVHDGRYFAVWTWAVPRSLAAAAAPSHPVASSTDDGWEDT